MSTAVKRACDACHRRKVKCDGINPCRNCSASQLTCTYNSIPQKKGPKGSRAKVINELKETQRQSTLTAKLQNGALASQTLAPTPRLLTKELLKTCVDFFFNHMYPIMPILERSRLDQDVMYMDQNLDTYCLLTSLCSFVSLQPGMVMPMTDPFNPDMMFGNNIVTGTLLMEETLRVRKGFDYVASPTLNSVCTSYFLFAVHHALEMHEKAWYHLREATTLVHMMSMNEEQAYLQCDNGDGIDVSRRRRLYWLLFVTERAYALRYRRPLSLQASIALPAPSDHPADPFAHSGTSFLRLIGLFRGFDEVLLQLWMKTKSECSDPYLMALEKQIQDVLPPYLNDTNAQLSEIQINQQWLKHKAWEVSIANGNDNNAGLSYVDNINMHELLPMVSHFPGNLGLQGLSLFEHLLNVTCALTEILAMQPAPRTPFIPSPHDQLRKILNVVHVIRNGEHRFLPLLLNKVHAELPKLASPMLQNAPESAACPATIDIFDGFGTAGMAQPPCGFSSEFDNKFGVPRLNDMTPNSQSGSNSNSPNSAPSGNNDMNSPFTTSSPGGIMSPGIDLPHGLQTDFTSMPEMVMSPMSHAPPPSSLPTSGAMADQQSQQPQHTPISPFSNSNHQIHNIAGSNVNPPTNMGLASQMHMGQGMNSGINTGLAQTVSSTSLLARVQPQQHRTHSFAMGMSQLRAVGGFQALQRANTDVMNPLTLNTMGTTIDFNALQR